MIPASNNPCAQVVSVAREDAAEPYITDFWPGNTYPLAVTAATVAGQLLVTSLLTHAMAVRHLRFSANAQNPP